VRDAQERGDARLDAGKVGDRLLPRLHLRAPRAEEPLAAVTVGPVEIHGDEPYA
jgi:hypothetical protein